MLNLVLQGDNGLAGVEKDEEANSSGMVCSSCLRKCRQLEETKSRRLQRTADG